MPPIDRQEKVTRDTILPLVTAELAEVTRHSPISEDQRLFEDLGMASTVRSGMAPRYTVISTRFGGKSIGMNATEGLKTVKESVDLVHRQANA